MKLRILILALAAVAAVAASSSNATGAGTSTWIIINSNGPVAVFGAARGLSAGTTEVVLERGTASPTLLAWLQSAERQPVTLLLVGADGTPVARHSLQNAWPKKWTGASLDASKNEVAIESLTLATEG